MSKVSGHISRFGFMVRREKAVHGVEGEGRGWECVIEWSQRKHIDPMSFMYVSEFSARGPNEYIADSIGKA